MKRADLIAQQCAEKAALGESHAATISAATAYDCPLTRVIDNALAETAKFEEQEKRHAKQRRMKTWLDERRRITDK